jgi:hypothetical protein
MIIFSHDCPVKFLLTAITTRSTPLIFAFFPFFYFSFTTISCGQLPAGLRFFRLFQKARGGRYGKHPMLCNPRIGPDTFSVSCFYLVSGRKLVFSKMSWDAEWLGKARRAEFSF